MSAYRIFVCSLLSFVILTVTAGDPMVCYCSYTSLDCSDRMKTVISDSEVDDCVSVSTFNFDRNYLRSLPDRIFNVKRSTIYGAKNELGLGPKQYFDSSEILDLSSNYINNANLFRYSCIVSILDLSNNAIDELGDNLLRCTSLSSFRIVNNKLTQLPNNVFYKNTNLHTLDLSENPIRSLFDGTFAGLRSLDTLHLREIQISEIPEGTFSNTRSLKHLELSGNDLTRLPSGLFAPLNLLETLNLRRNRINQLPTGIFDDLNYLTVLNLDFNELEELPPQLFKRLHSLQHLSARDNFLTTLPSLLQCSGPLRSVALRGNAISSLDETAVRALWRLDFDYADLRDNPVEVPDWALNASDVSVKYDGKHEFFQLVVENHGIITTSIAAESSTIYGVAS